MDKKSTYTPEWIPLTIPGHASPEIERERKVVEESFRTTLESLSYPILFAMSAQNLPTGRSYDGDTQSKEQLITLLLAETLHLWTQSREGAAVVTADQRNLSAVEKGKLVFSDGMFLHGVPLRHLRSKADGLFCTELYPGGVETQGRNGVVFISSLQTNQDLSQLTPAEVLNNYNFARFSNPMEKNITLILADQSSRIRSPIPGLPAAGTRYVALGFTIGIGMPATDIKGAIATVEQHRFPRPYRRGTYQSNCVCPLSSFPCSAT